MTNEVELNARLKEVEKSIKKLRETDLLIAKQMALCVCPIEMNIAVRTMTSEASERFRQIFPEKLKETKGRINESKTPKEIFQILVELDKEIGRYVTATKVENADVAMETAHTFIIKYNPVALPLKAIKEGDVWLVDVDIGTVSVKVAKVKIDARTGDILSYEIPEKE